ncbi:hypothetical protein QMK17_17000 [Rhodococcus sp. G-MC3]|uniref:hypothetical protein n=1 Tax=Rhodococcus sp. G-MC3 TaxID=3046209 RepID=UPI0024B8C24F|nr:hypothetical protein [Rhodococcus sp. G-MC3]MDJ0395024.1 hypothetical protein [Rhodococcus sp. G-MC3]
MTRVQRILATLALTSVLGLATSGCGSTEPSAGTDLAAPPATSLATAAPEATDSSGVPAAAPEVVTPEVVTPDPAEAAANSAPVAIPPVPNRDDVNVDARDFERGDGQYFFKTPSGNAFCAFHSSNAPGTDVGCQVHYSVPGNTGRLCLNTENNTYGVQIRNGGTVEQICTNQGIFVNTDPRVLEYGQTIGVQGDICRSTEAGVTCYSGSGSGFMISRDVNIAF